MMEALNFETGEMPESLREFNNQSVEVAGFIVPLEMDEDIDQVKEFFLVPDPLACNHVPPPPPNQMIYVTMAKEIPLDMDFRGVSINGVLKFSKEEDGVFGFELSGETAVEAEIEYEDHKSTTIYASLLIKSGRVKPDTICLKKHQSGRLYITNSN